MDGFGIQIANLNFRLLIDNDVDLFKRFHSDFLTSESPDYRIDLKLGPIPRLIIPKKGRLFSGIWDVYTCPEKYYLLLHKSRSKIFPRRLAVISKDLKDANFYIDSKKYFEKSVNNCYELTFPLLRFYLINILSSDNGIIIHGSGIIKGGKGYLFIGISQSGKTTIAKLFESEGAIILNDNNVVIRKSNKKFKLFGLNKDCNTRICSNKNIKLEAIFFISHSEKNYLNEINDFDVVAKIFSHTFLPLWERKMLKNPSKLISDIATKVPAFKLGFVPNKSVVKFIEEKVK